MGELEPIQQEMETQVGAEETKEVSVPELPEQFLWNGEKWTREEAKNAWLRQSDYTKKTREIAEQREKYEGSVKYWDNLQYDYPKVLSNPQLAQEFMKIYPEQFHYLVKHLVKEQPQGSVDPKLMSRLEKIEKHFTEQEVKQAESKIDAVFAKFQDKYPLADQSLVLSLAQSAHQQGVDLDKDQAWEGIFKQAQTRVETLAKKHYGTLVNKQKEASTRAKDVSPGGGTPGQAPNNPKNLKEATLAALRDAELGQGAFAR